jgi:transcriptional regulator with XRE-family HTH domain
MSSDARGDTVVRKRPPHRRGPFQHYNVLSEPNPNPQDADALKREFGRRLQERMDDLGWNQSELSRRATEWLPKPAKGQKQGHQIGRDAISNYVRGEHLPRPAQLRALARALECDESDLLPVSSVPTVATASPEYSMTSEGLGLTFLRVAKTIPTDIALQIIQLLAKAEGKK